MFNYFNKRFAFQYEAPYGDWEGWTPPWLRHDRHDRHEHGHRHEHDHGHEHDSRFFEMRGGRRGFFGPGGPGEHGGPFKGGSRFFGRGDVKYALLDLIQERPMHGYEMMKALEERSGGFYAPSAGTIYPTLQLLEDRGLVTVKEQESKKVYSITEAGQAFLAERQKEEENFTPPWARGRGGHGPGHLWNEPEIQAIRTEAMEVARLFAIAGRSSFRDTQKLAKLRVILERTHKDLTDFIYSNPEQPTSETPPTDEGQ
jgi:DNA-binding PadR family transcriptional regulator